MVVLEDEADHLVAEARQLRFGQGEGVAAADLHGAAARLVEGADNVQEGALARARGPRDRQRLARLQLEVDPVEDAQRLPLLELLAQPANLEPEGPGRGAAVGTAVSAHGGGASSSCAAMMAGISIDRIGSPGLQMQQADEISPLASFSSPLQKSQA